MSDIVDGFVAAVFYVLLLFAILFVVALVTAPVIVAVLWYTGHLSFEYAVIFLLLIAIYYGIG